MQRQAVGSRLSPCSHIGIRRNLGRLLLFTFFLLFAVTSRAAAPANDVCASAQTIPPGGPFPLVTPVIDITDATISPQDPPLPAIYANAVSRSVWYVFR